MNKVRSRIKGLLLLPLLLLTCGQAGAANNNYEYHADARMQHATQGSVKDAYGYVYVVTDKKGHGVSGSCFRMDRRWIMHGSTLA